ncbi:TPA: hypothetical protein PC537_002802 [Morganella morganii]|nr:hypothetical protein [Morganella morganii]
MTLRVNLTAWRPRLKRQICRGIAVRFLAAGWVMLSALLPVYLLHSLTVQHLALLLVISDEREARLVRQRAEFTRLLAVQQQAEADKQRQQQTCLENCRYRELLSFLQRQLPEDAWLARYQAERQQHDKESTVRHALAINRRQVIAPSHPLLHHAPPGLIPLRLISLHHHKTANIRQFVLVTGESLP